MRGYIWIHGYSRNRLQIRQFCMHESQCTIYIYYLWLNTVDDRLSYVFSCRIRHLYEAKTARKYTRFHYANKVLRCILHYGLRHLGRLCQTLVDDCAGWTSRSEVEKERKYISGRHKSDSCRSTMINESASDSAMLSPVPRASWPCFQLPTNALQDFGNNASFNIRQLQWLPIWREMKAIPTIDQPSAVLNDFGEQVPSVRD